MLKVLLIIILSPVVLTCGIISIAIILALLEMFRKLILQTAESLSNLINKRDDT